MMIGVSRGHLKESAWRRSVYCRSAIGNDANVHRRIARRATVPVRRNEYDLPDTPASAPPHTHTRPVGAMFQHDVLCNR